MFRKFSLFLIGSIISTFVAASVFALDLNASKTTVATGERFWLTVTDTQSGNAVQTTLPTPTGLNDFSIISQSSNMEMVAINGKTESRISNTYELVGEKPGIFLISLPGSQKNASVRISVTKSEPQKSWSDTNTTTNPIVDTPQETSDPWNLEDWIMLSGAIVIVGIICFFLFLRFLSIQSNSKRSSVPLTDMIQSTEAETIAHDTESIVGLLRTDLENRSGIPTKYLTYAQLLEIESSPGRKELLQKILHQLQLREYGNASIDIHTINELVRKFLSRS